MYCDLIKDSFTFRVSLPEKPFTRRGVLSIINSVDDPLGPVAPVLLEGKLILRELVKMCDRKANDHPLGWDDPLPECQMRRWQTWREALPKLEDLHISRCYHPPQFGLVIRSEIHAFSDASQLGIGTAVYLKLINDRNDVNVTLLFGQAKVAPAHVTTIPRLELCAAVLSSQAVKNLLKELNMKTDEVNFYTDSKFVLGYIKNDSRRFYQYVANRVQIIRTISDPDQWKYTATNLLRTNYERTYYEPATNIDAANLHKKGDKEHAENYRPISLLCIVSKVLERCVLNNIKKHLFELVNPCQHGFITGRSCVTNLLETLDDIGSLLDSGGQVDVIYLDMSKAFDKVSHKLLINKLHRFGFGGQVLQWFRSYLTHRLQRVTVQGASSDLLPVTSGVPQGSIYPWPGAFYTVRKRPSRCCQVQPSCHVCR